MPPAITGEQHDPHAQTQMPTNNCEDGTARRDPRSTGMTSCYPHDAKADPTKAYVMWPGTPYEHLMLPVK
jgi:hypothetical protein